MSSDSDSDEEFHSGAELDISDIEEDELNELLERCSQGNKNQKDVLTLDPTKSNLSEPVCNEIPKGTTHTKTPEATSDLKTKEIIQLPETTKAESEPTLAEESAKVAKAKQDCFAKTTSAPDSEKVTVEKLDKKIDSLSLRQDAAKGSNEPKSDEPVAGSIKEDLDEDREWGDGWEVEDVDVDQVISSNETSSDPYPANNDKIQPLSTSSNTNQTKSGWSSWNSWGGGVFDLGTNLLSSATEGVTGITNILQNTIKAPDPAELAQQMGNEKSDASPDSLSTLPIDPARVTGLVNNLFDGVSTLGTKVISGGLDTLETIGKKTIDAIPLGDPELRKTANLFQGEKINLSQVLREARERTEVTESTQESKTRLAQYETIFDDSNGSLYLEALQMTSDESKVKLNLLRSNTGLCTLEDYNQAAKQVTDLFDNNPYDSSDDDVIATLSLDESLKNIKETLLLNINPNNVTEVYSRISSRIDDPSLLPSDASEIHCCAITDMAHLTAYSLGVIHRMAELILIQKDSDVDLLFEEVSRFVATVKSIINKISESYAQKLNGIDDKRSNAMINNLFLEDTNSSSHLDKAFELFSPIFQLKVLSQSLDEDR